jgi:hypothetical protein
MDWYLKGCQTNKKFLVVVCDTFEWEDYPLYFEKKEDTVKFLQKPGDMQKVMEVYCLSKPFDNQTKLMNGRVHDTGDQG